MKKINEHMYEKVVEAAKNAYAPYSRFSVGAVIRLKDGSYITGSNVENASYGLTNCAERSALFSAYSKGYRKNDILEMMIIGDTKEPISPCGACRQVMNELMDQECNIVLTNFKKDILEYKVKDLLPYSFTDGDLHNE